MSVINKGQLLTIFNQCGTLHTRMETPKYQYNPRVEDFRRNRMAGDKSSQFRIG